MLTLFPQLRSDEIKICKTLKHSKIDLPKLESLDRNRIEFIESATDKQRLTHEILENGSKYLSDLVCLQAFSKQIGGFDEQTNSHLFSDGRPKY